MPIDASPSGTLDIENATLRSREIVALTSMVTGNDVIRSSNPPALEVYGDPSHGGNEARLELVSNTATVSSSAFTRLTSNAGVLSIKTGTDASDNGTITFGGFTNERMRIGSDGKVGVGTNNPDARLHLEEPSDISATTRLFHTENGFTGGSVGHFEIVEKKTGAGTGWSDFTLRLQRRVDTTEQGYIEFNPTGSTGDYGIAFGNSGGGGPGEIMRIVGLSGNVGIGTTNPLELLDIAKLGNDNFIRIQAGGAASNFGGIQFTENGIRYGWRQFYDALTDKLFFSTQNNNNEIVSNVMVMTTAGNVGIGTNDPESSLEVHGTGIHINGTVLRSYSGIGAMTAGQWYKVCDFSALPATVSGVCVIRIRWGGGSSTNVTYYWNGYASGIVPYNTYGDGSGTYNAAPQEPLTLTQHYHHRVAGAFEFKLDSDASGGSYGRQSIYIKTPQSLSDLGLEVIAMPLRR